MANNEPKSDVYVFKNPNVTLDGTEYCLSSLSIILKENAIPTLRLSVDPAHTPEDPMNPATPATLNNILKWHTKLQNLTATKKTGSVSLEVHNTSGLEQTIALKDWLITGAGILGTSAAGSFALEVEMQHPLAGCDYSAMNLGNFIGPVDLMSKEHDIRGDNIIDTLHKALVAYSEIPLDPKAVDVECAEPVAPSIASLRTKLQDATAALGLHLEWRPEMSEGDCGYTEWPVEDCLDESTTTGAPNIDALVETIAGYVVGQSEFTIWELVAAVFCPHWAVSIIPTFWLDALALAPYTPWGYPSTIILDSEINDITFPGMDPAPIAGTFLQMQAPCAGADSTTFGSGLQDSIINIEAIPYVVDGIDGRITRLESPDWLKGLSMVSAGQSSGRTSPAGKGQSRVHTSSSTLIGHSPASDTADQYSVNAETYRGILYRCAKQYFLSSFKREVTVTLNTKLLLALPSNRSAIEGGWVIPGQSCGVQTHDEVDVFDFYITEVVHTIDCQNSRAGTVIKGGYARPGAVGGGIVPTGTCNPLYSSEDDD